MISKEKVIFAPGINSGGGLTLFKAIEPYLLERGILAILDARIMPYVSQAMADKATFFSQGLVGRLQAELFLFRNFDRNARVLCFSNVAPLFYRGNNISIFFQNVMLIKKTNNASANVTTKILSCIRQLINNFLLPRTGQYIVQTESVRQLLIDKIKISPSHIQIFPFTSEKDVNKTGVSLKQKKQFLYVASDEPHKNHWALLNAWKLLKDRGFDLRLVLTIENEESQLWRQLSAYIKEYDIDVINVGRLDSENLEKLYLESEALIYPSLCESFGLPLIEATRLNLDIIASELDFVRDVCSPCQTFDPDSSLSLCRAVIRFTGGQEVEFFKIHSPDQFVEKVYDNTNRKIK